MNKKQAAEFLGISPRMLEKHVQNHHLSVRKVKGKTNDVAIYDDRELKELKARLDSKKTLIPSIVLNSEYHEPQPRTTNTAIALSEKFAASERSVGAMASAFVGALTLGDRLMLNLDDAALLTRLSKNYLREAIRAERLKARVIGRGYKIKRTDLDAFIKKL